MANQSQLRSSTIRIYGETMRISADDNAIYLGLVFERNISKYTKDWEISTIQRNDACARVRRAVVSMTQMWNNTVTGQKLSMPNFSKPKSVICQSG